MHGWNRLVKLIIGAQSDRFLVFSTPNLNEFQVLRERKEKYEEFKKRIQDRKKF